MAPRTRKRAAEEDEDPAPVKDGSAAAKSAGSKKPKVAMGERLTSALKDECTCAICTEIFESPLTLACGHSFCQSCIQRSLTSAAGKRCPTCRGKIKGPLPAPARAAAAMVTAYLSGLDDDERQEELDRRLALAVQAYQPARVAELLALGADVDAHGASPSSGRSVRALNLACVYCKQAADKGAAVVDSSDDEEDEEVGLREERIAASGEIALHLVKAGARLSATDLDYACANAERGYAAGRTKWEAVVVEMLRKGCKPDPAGRPNTLRSAIRGTSEKVCLQLVQAGAAVDCGYATDGDSRGEGLRMAARRGYHDLVYAMVNKGAAVKKRDDGVRNSYWLGWEKAHPGQAK